MHTLHTIGYELATIQTLVATLKKARVELVVDVRAVASSRRPGFSKTRLSAGLEEAGIGYLHLRGLGTPAEGRAAARTGRYGDLRRIYGAHIKTLAAKDDLMTLAELVQSGRRVCLLCLEASPEHCHRTMVAEALEAIVPFRVKHLFPAPE
jgi:uncharacterized protein (DUF488 family)